MRRPQFFAASKIVQHVPQVHSGTEANLVLKSVTNLAKSLAEASSTTRTPEEVQEAMDAAIAALESMVPTLAEEHSLAQRQVDRQFDEIEACRNHATRGVLSTTQNAEEVETKRTSLNRCNDRNDDAQSAQRTAHDAWDNLVSMLVDSQPGRLTATNFHNAWITWKEFIETNDPTVAAHLADLNTATSAAESMAEECASETVVYGEAFCQHRLSCAMLGACQAHETQVYHEMLDDINSGMDSRQAQSATIEQVHCILHLISAAVEVNNTLSLDELDACQPTNSINPELVIAFHTMPDAHGCPAAATGDPDCPGLADVEEITAWSGGEVAAIEALPTDGMTTCAEVYASGHTESGTYTMSVAGQVRNMHCEMADDGQWMLVTVTNTAPESNYDKYPMNGDNYEGLASDTEDWASLSENEFHDVGFTLENAVLKLDVPQQDRKFYIQRTSTADFSPFRGIRYVPEWGTANVDYQMCEHRFDCYDPSTSTVTHDGFGMEHWESHMISVEGQQIEVSRHGIPGDHGDGCQWMYWFRPDICGPTQNAAWCNGVCNNWLGDSLENTISKVYVGGH